jgi:large subunit ribosomal protein L7Ae
MKCHKPFVTAKSSFICLLVDAATQLFRLMDKYRPESKREKLIRLKGQAEKRVKGKPDQPTKSGPVVRSGVNTVTCLVEKKKAQLVVIAHDVDPIEVRHCYI